MKRKMYWALAAFGITLVGVAVFVIQHEITTTRQLKKELAEANKLLEERNTQQEMQKVIYVDNDVKRPPPPGKSFENGGHWHGDQWHDTPHETDTKVSNGKLSHTNPSDASTASAHSLQKMRELKKRIDNINVRVQAKYPELQDLALLTPEEIHARYPTDNDKLALAQKAEDFLDEFLLEIKEAFSDAPIEIRKSVWDEIRPQLVSSLGKETADVMLAVVQDLFE